MMAILLHRGDSLDPSSYSRPCDRPFYPFPEMWPSYLAGPGSNMGLEDFRFGELRSYWYDQEHTKVWSSLAGLWSPRQSQDK